MLYIKKFLKYNIYIGHSVSSSVILSSWFFYKLKKSIWIINIFKTIIFLKVIIKFLRCLVNNNMPFWFVNFEYTKKKIFNYYAKSCGEFPCTEKWIRGFLSNYKNITKVVKNYIKKKKMHEKSIHKVYLMRNWVYTRYTWPRSIFLSNIPLNYIVCKEAVNIALPVVAMVDTNVKSYLFTYPIPANDDSFSSVSFILILLSKHILLCKYKKVVLWYKRYKISKLKSLNLFKQMVNKLVKIKNIKNIFFNILRHKSINFILDARLFHTVKRVKYGIKQIFSYIRLKKNISTPPDLALLNKLQRRIKHLRLFHRKNKSLKNTLRKNYYSGYLNTRNILKKTRMFKKYGLRKKRRSFFNFRYLYITNLLRKINIFHESFIINQPIIGITF